VLLQRHEALPMAEPEPSLCALPLTLQPFTDTPDARGRGAQVFKVGGTPSWAQDDEYYRCVCGADLVYVCLVPEGMEFAIHPGQPERPYSLRAETYWLFLGNEVYLLLPGPL
jgi:hypothetical protein